LRAGCMMLWHLQLLLRRVLLLLEVVATLQQR
jgi:hypothetical protein